jgi:hypothetical protein
MYWPLFAKFRAPKAIFIVNFSRYNQALTSRSNIAGDGEMVGNWESVTIDELFALREQIHEVLIAKLKAKRGELELRSQQVNRQVRLLETVKHGPLGLLISFGSCDCVSKLLPLVSNL